MARINKAYAVAKLKMVASNLVANSLDFTHVNKTKGQRYDGLTTHPVLVRYTVSRTSNLWLGV